MGAREHVVRSAEYHFRGKSFTWIFLIKMKIIKKVNPKKRELLDHHKLGVISANVSPHNIEADAYLKTRPEILEMG